MGILVLSGSKKLVEFFELVDERSWGYGALVRRISADVDV